MYKNRLRSLLIHTNVFFFLISTAICQEQADTTESVIESNFQLVRNSFSGENAYNTVAFVEQFWRIAGNSGFDSSIYYVADLLQEAGYVLEEKATNDDILTYRIESRPMEDLTWEPVSAELDIIEEEGPRKILDFTTNRNMIAVNSWSTPPNGVEAELIYITPGITEEELKQMDVDGKVVFAEQHLRRLFRQMVIQKGALGIIAYSNPEYLQPEKYKHSIQFSSIPQDTVNRSWGLAISNNARMELLDAVDSGNVKVRVKVQTRLYKSEELTLVADIKGSKFPDERIVYSAHVQEPGANDNASGVGAQAEMARVAAELIKSGNFKPDRTMTFLFGDEIISTRRYIQENESRAKGIKWGVSLDMVGENTKVTGGSFLIEKMPDPSAVWTRGEEKHTEWGGSPISKDRIVPGYFNDFMIDVFKRQGEHASWTVNTNPYEGGSDHVPFLRANIPGLLLWHFTDAFYHTDGDRLDKVSASTLQNVGTGALVAGMTLVNGDENLFNFMLEILSREANSRLQKEFTLSKTAMAQGSSKDQESEILSTWADYYIKSMNTTRQLVHSSDLTSDMEQNIRSYQKRIKNLGDKLVRRLDY